MPLRTPLAINTTEGFAEEIVNTDTIDLRAGAQIAGDLTFSASGEPKGLPNTPTSDDAASSKYYVDNLVVTGGPVREAVLHEAQLDNTEGVLAATALVISTNPVEDDFVEITDGTTTRQYEFGAVLTTGDVLVAIGATPWDTMQNLATAIQGDGSAIWGAYATQDLDAINANGVVVVVEDDNDGTVSRVYGTWATQANIQHVDFDGELDYTKKTLTQLDTSDPGAGNPNFGYRDTQTALVDGEIHYVLHNDTLYSWDDSSNTWQTLSGGAALPDATSASGGGTKGKVTFDSDKGLVIVAGVGAVQLETDGAIVFDGTNGGLEINLETTNPTLDITTNELGVRFGATSGLEQVAAGLQVKVDGATVQRNGTTGALEVISTNLPADRIENALNVDEAISAGDPVYFTSTGDRVGQADAAVDAESRVIGVAKTAQGTVGDPATIVSIGECAGVLSSATPGTPYFLASGGGYTTTLPTGNVRVVRIGYAVSADDLWVEISDFGKRRNP